MFTGIVEGIGEILEIATAPGSRGRLRVRAGPLLPGCGIGESIAVNGVCLTIVAEDPTTAGPVEFAAELSPETLRRTTLGRLRAGDRVNLERPLRAADRLGGHFVQGHVDGVGEITEVRPEGTGLWMEIRVPQELGPYLVEKGSVAVDGISLTVAGLPALDRFAVALIPHTVSHTTLGQRKAGQPVNLEMDILAKYVERMVQGARAP